VRIPDEPENTDESPAEYEYADSKFKLNNLLQRPGATIEGRYFASQPAPVSVVLPERREPTPDSPYLTDEDIEWNACLDKVKELNQ
jgi:hypothetical protein